MNNTGTERYCACGHGEQTHIIEKPNSICAHKGCSCSVFVLREAVVEDPWGNRHHITDVAKFVREHADLFDPEDVLMRKMPCWVNYPGLTGQYCRAEAGLDHVVADSVGSWKGWTLLIKPASLRRNR
jgi:hypothetical protein